MEVPPFLVVLFSLLFLHKLFFRLVTEPEKTLKRLWDRGLDGIFFVV
jgi:hypothetical protein